MMQAQEIVSRKWRSLCRIFKNYPHQLVNKNDAFKSMSNAASNDPDEQQRIPPGALIYL